MVHIDFSSAASTNSFQVLCFACLTFWLYSLRFFFYSSQSMLLPVFLCRFLTWFSSFLNFVSSSFHHLLLKGDGFLRGAVSAIALLIASVIPMANSSMASAVASAWRSEHGGRYSYSLASCVFQSVLVKLYGGCVGVVSRGVRSRMVSIGRWSDPWLFSVAIWHFTMLFVACPLPHTRSIAVFPSGNVIVPGGISSCIPCWSIPSVNSSACWSCL